MLIDELLAWARLADLYRDHTALMRRAAACAPLPHSPSAAWRADHAHAPIVEPPRLDARLILGRWLADRRATGRRARVA
jgi:hypothetical protein